MVTRCLPPDKATPVGPSQRGESGHGGLAHGQWQSPRRSNGGTLWNQLRPVSEWLHEPLTSSERVARLRTVVSTHGFRKRLRMPNKSFHGKPRLPLMASGDRQLVANLVDNMFTESPVSCRLRPRSGRNCSPLRRERGPLLPAATMLMLARLGLRGVGHPHAAPDFSLTSGSPCFTSGLTACPSTLQATAHASPSAPEVRNRAPAPLWPSAGRLRVVGCG